MDRGSFSIKESYNIKIGNQEDDEGTWKKIWISNMCPKVALFTWLVVKGRIITNENLRRRGVQGPSQCCMCYQEEESMGHLLDSCPFAVAIWDKGAMGFRRCNKRRG